MISLRRLDVSKLRYASSWRNFFPSSRTRYQNLLQIPIFSQKLELLQILHNGGVIIPPGTSKRKLSYLLLFLDMTARDFARIALLLVNDGVWLGEQIIPLSYVQAIKNITTTSLVTGDYYQGTLSYGLKFWSVYGGNVCGLDGSGNLNNGEKCVADNTIITPQGFDGQYTMMDFQNKLIMIRFSLYHHANSLGATEKKMVADSPPPQ